MGLSSPLRTVVFSMEGRSYSGRNWGRKRKFVARLEELFSRARIVGIDVNPECRRYADGRIVIEIGSQEDPEFLHYICRKYLPTVIIDDGSHQAHHIIYSFEQLFPALASGGLYIVEDLDFHFGEDAERWAPVKGYDPPKYFLDLTSSCMTRKHRNEFWGTRRSFISDFDSICCINSAVCVQKKRPQQRSADLQAVLC